MDDNESEKLSGEIAEKIQNEMKAMWAWFCAQKIPEWMGGDYKDMAAIQYDQIAWWADHHGSKEFQEWFLGSCPDGHNCPRSFGAWLDEVSCLVA